MKIYYVVITRVNIEFLDRNYDKFINSEISNNNFFKIPMLTCSEVLPFIILPIIIITR